MKLLESKWFPIILGVVILSVIISDNFLSSAKTVSKYKRHIRPFFYEDSLWQTPDINDISSDSERNLVLYGKSLFANTSYYLGPRGQVAAVSNGMNCQNCHLEAGARNYANCLSAVASNYPRYRERSGRVETIEFRVNDCMQRSLNGKAIDSNGYEMKALVAYIKWLGCEVPPKITPRGAGTVSLAFLDRAADTARGRIAFESKCISCHGNDGQGLMKADSTGYVYPPLWGENSYNVSAGLYRLSKLAAYIKYAMPFNKSSYNNPVLSDDEAWDIAAFICSKPRPEKFFNNDWPQLASKPVDFPFGPYADHFSVTQHKYGPFQSMLQSKAMAKK